MEENNVVKNEGKDNGKKKKIIIIAAIAVVVVAAAVAIYFLMGNQDPGYVDIPVTEIVTDENGEAVTNVYGEVVTEVVTDANGLSVTEKQTAGNANKPAASNNQGNSSGKKPGNSGSGNNAGGNNGPANSNNDNNNGSNNNGNNNNDNNNNNNNNNNSGNNNDKKPEDEKPKNRKIQVTAVLPAGCKADDVLQIYVNGELDSEVVVDNNKTVVVETENEYKDEVTVKVVLKDYGTSAEKAVLNNHTGVRLELPLNTIEVMPGEND